VVRLGHDDLNVLPYGFINGVTKHFFGSRIKRFNDAIFADRYDCINGCLYDRFEPCYGFGLICFRYFRLRHLYTP